MAAGTPDHARSAEVPAVLQAVLKRRSCREFSAGRLLSETDVRSIVQCGLAAPSSKNAQPWRLHVVWAGAVLDSFASAARSHVEAATYVPHDPQTAAPHGRYASTVTESAAVLATCSTAIFIENKGVFSGGSQGLLRAPRKGLVSGLMGFSLELVGIGACLENMWLAAESLGLRAAFMGDLVIAEETIGQTLGFTGDLVGVLALGHGAAPDYPRTAAGTCDPTAVVWH